MIRVVFGETHGGAFMGNESMVRMSADQVTAFETSEGTILLAWIDPEDEFNAILELERPDAVQR